MTFFGGLVCGMILMGAIWAGLSWLGASSEFDE